MKTNLIDYIDFEKINLLLEGFNKTTGFVTAILDLDGNILSKSGWRQICTQYHRINPETAKKCTISDTVLAGKLGEGEKYNSYKCLNGLVDVAVPVIINNEHVANLFSGQFFFEKPDRDFFIKQAQKYNFNNKDYLAALDKVPVVSEEKAKLAMDFLLDMTLLISDMTQQRIEQIELNKTLKESEERFRALYHNSPDMYVSVSASDASILECNETLLKNLAYSREEVIGAPIFKMYHESCLEEVKNAFQQFVEVGEILGKELILKRKDGSSIEVSLSVRSVKDENGKTLYSISSWRDITVQKRTEELLKKSEARFRKMFDNATFGMIVCELIRDDQGKAIDYVHEQVNEALKKHIGISNTDIIGKKCSEIMSAEESAHFVEKFSEVVETGEPFEYVMYYPGFDRTVDNRSFYLEDDYFAVIFFDISERKKAENIINKTTANLESLLDNRKDFIWSLDKNYNYIIFNKPYAELIFREQGITLEKGMYAFDAQPTEIQNFWKSKFKPVFEGENVVFEFTQKLKDSDHYFQFFLNPIKTEGTVTGASVLGMDITEHKKAEFALVESEEKYRQLYESNQMPISIFDSENLKYLSVNDAYVEKYGYTKEEFLNMTILDIRPDSEIEKLKQSVAKIDNGQLINAGIFLHQKKNGEIIQVEILRYDLVFEGKNAKLVFVNDITERKKAEEELRKIHENLQERNDYIESILENMPIGFALNTIDDGAVKYMNNQFEEIYGWSRDILLNINTFFEKVFPEPEYREKMQAKIIADMQSGDPGRMNWKDLKIVTSLGEVRYVNAFNIPISEQNLMISTVQDTTKRKMAEEELSEYRGNLEKLVEERTAELEQKNALLERMNNLFVGRELRMAELKEKIKKLESNG